MNADTAPQHLAAVRNKSTWAIIALVAVALVRMWLFLKTPLRLQADAGCDDLLMVEYALSMLNLEWLGPFQEMTLVKVPAFSILLALGYVLNLPYTFLLFVFHALACALFAQSLYALTKSRWLAVLCCVCLLFSPAMMHEENVQKVYRGGYIVVFTLLVVASFVGLYARRERVRYMWSWAVLGAISLPVFWYLKEDSVWIAPFVAVAGLVTVGLIALGKDGTKKVLRVALVLVPFAALLVAGVTYRALNKAYYGVFITTDRQEGGFHEVVGDLLRIAPAAEDPNNWVSHDQLKAALSVSPTLNELTGGIEALTADDGEFAVDGGKTIGDFYIWRLRHKVANQGAYDNGAAYVNDAYAKVHQELTEAFADGRLAERSDVVRMSSLAKGFTTNELAQYFGTRFPEALSCILTYAENQTTIVAATGEGFDLATMAEITNSSCVWPEGEGSLDRWMRLAVRADNAVVWLFQVTGWVTAVVALLGHVLLLVRTILRKEEFCGRLLLVSGGILATMLVLLFGVLWFCNFLSMRKVYDYYCGGIVLLDAWKCVGIWYVCHMAGEWVGRMRADKEVRA